MGLLTDGVITQRRQSRRADTLLLLLVAGVTVLTVAGLLHWPLQTGILVCVVVGTALLRFPRAYIALAGATLPFAPTLVVPLGSAGVIAITDIAAVGALVGMAVQPSRYTTRIWHAIQPVVFLALPYLFIALLVAVRSSDVIGSTITVAQRAELVIVWVLLGACVARNSLLRDFLAPFVIACSFLAVMWIMSPGSGAILGLQKNPTGGFLAAALIVVAISQITAIWKLPLVALLALGLVFTGSRGSIVGFAASALVLVVFTSQWRRIGFSFISLALAAVIAMNILPRDQLDRLLGEDQSAQYTTNTREWFIRDAITQWQQNPLGVGPGNYRQVDERLQRIATSDPHNAYVLALVEGGLPLLIAFLALAAGTLLWVLRTRRTRLGILALATQFGILIHVIVDVYWVRGTPSIGWLLIGAAAVSLHQNGRASPAELEPRAMNRR